MLKLVIGIVGKADERDLKYIEAKIQEYFPPIREIDIIHLPEDYQKWIIRMFKKISLVTFFYSQFYEKRALRKFRDDFVKEPDSLACLLFFMKRSLLLELNYALEHDKVVCVQVDESPRTSKRNLAAILHELGHLFDLGDVGFKFEGEKYVHSGPCIMVGPFTSKKCPDEFCSDCKRRIMRFK